MTPIYQTSTYVQAAPGEIKGYDYSRTCNPTRTALDGNIAGLEGGKFGLSFSSGMSAINTILNLLKSGDHVIATVRPVRRHLPAVHDALREVRRVVHVHGPQRPRRSPRGDPPETKVAVRRDAVEPAAARLRPDALAEICRWSGDILSVCDNTFATPFNQNGRSRSVSSTTSCTRRPSTWAATRTSSAARSSSTARTSASGLHHFQNTVGGTPGPMDCFLVLRGTKTLHVRMQRHADNAAANRSPTSRRTRRSPR